MSADTSASVQKHFDGIASSYSGIVDSIWYDVGYYHTRELEFVRQNLPLRVHLAIDAGCGPGRHLLALMSRSRRVLAVDVSRNMLVEAGRAVPAEQKGRLHLVQADVRSLPLRDGVADFIINLEVIEHLPERLRDIRLALRELHRVLQPRGAVVAEAPLERHQWVRRFFAPPTLKEMSEELVRKVYTEAPLLVQNAFKDENLEAFFRESGFGIVSKAFVRCLPAGVIEQYPGLQLLDRILETIPLVRRLSREVIWLLRPSELGVHNRGVPGIHPKSGASRVPVRNGPGRGQA